MFTKKAFTLRWDLIEDTEVEYWYLYFTWVHPRYVTLYFYSTAFWKTKMYFLLHYMCLTALVTLQIQIIDAKYNSTNKSVTQQCVK